jgi:hypothetical protein
MSWRTARSLIVLRAQIDVMAPNRSKASDGTIGDAAHATRDSDHNPWVTDGRVGVVTAMDITHDPQHACDAQDLVSRIVESRDKRVKYIIWNHQIISSVTKPWVWRPYTGRNPHTRHFHLSVHADRSLYDLGSVWAL